jgi:hypothetical protein
MEEIPNMIDANHDVTDEDRRKLAEKWMGWTHVGMIGQSIGNWHPERDLKQAYMLVDAMGSHSMETLNRFLAHLCALTGGGAIFEAIFFGRANGGTTFKIDRARVTTLAALMAMEEVDRGKVS